MSGAHVELSRAPPPNPSEKFFIIRGNAEQIDNAQRMISEKIGLATSPMSGGKGMDEVSEVVDVVASVV